MAELTPRQVRELNAVIRHIGRAMKAMERANVLLPAPTVEEQPEYLIHSADEDLGRASDRLIDALELHQDQQGERA